MGYKLTNSGGDYTPPPAGNHLSCCCGVYYIGYQASQFGEKPQLILQFELVDEMREDGEPFIVSSFYTANTAPKSNFSKMMGQWRGKPFEKGELEGFDIARLLGKAALVNVVHKQKTDGSGEISAKIAAVSPLPKGTPKPEMKSQPLDYNVDEPDSVKFAKVPDWIKEQCNKRIQQVARPTAPPLAAPPDPGGEWGEAPPPRDYEEAPF